MIDETIVDEENLGGEETTPEVAEQQQEQESPETTKEQGESSSSVDTQSENSTSLGVQRKINKLTGRVYERDRRIAELEGKLAGDGQTIAPTLEDCDFDETKFNQATIEHHVKVALNAQNTANAQQAQENEISAGREELANGFALKEAEFSASNADYEKTVANLPQFPADTLNAIFSLDNGPQVAQYLGSHLDVAGEIANANPIQAAIRLGKIAGGLTKAKQTVSASNAPDPVDTVEGSARVSTEGGPKGATYE